MHRMYNSVPKRVLGGRMEEPLPAAAEERIVPEEGIGV